MPHLVHYGIWSAQAGAIVLIRRTLVSGLVVIRDMPSSPMNGGIVAHAMMYMRRPSQRIVANPTITNRVTDVQFIGMFKRMTWRFAVVDSQSRLQTDMMANVLKPRLWLMMLPKVVIPPLGTLDRKALAPLK